MLQDFVCTLPYNVQGVETGLMACQLEISKLGKEIAEKTSPTSESTSQQATSNYASLPSSDKANGRISSQRLMGDSEHRKIEQFLI